MPKNPTPQPTEAAPAAGPEPLPPQMVFEDRLIAIDAQLGMFEAACEYAAGCKGDSLSTKLTADAFSGLAVTFRQLRKELDSIGEEFYPLVRAGGAR